MAVHSLTIDKLHSTTTKYQNKQLNPHTMIRKSFHYHLSSNIHSNIHFNSVIFELELSINNKLTLIRSTFICPINLPPISHCQSRSSHFNHLVFQFVSHLSLGNDKEVNKIINSLCAWREWFQSKASLIDSSSVWIAPCQTYSNEENGLLTLESDFITLICMRVVEINGFSVCTVFGIKPRLKCCVAQD